MSEQRVLTWSARFEKWLVDFFLLWGILKHSFLTPYRLVLTKWKGDVEFARLLLRRV